MRLGLPVDDLGSSSEPSLNGSFRRARSSSQLPSIHHFQGFSDPLPEENVTSSSSSKFVPTSERVHQVLKDYASQLVDMNLFTQYVEEWVLEIVQADSANAEPCSKTPFDINELCTLDYALEGVLFQQLFRMPSLSYNSENLQEDEFLALEDFLHTMAEGLWQTFWHKKKPFPFSVSFPRYPGSKFYTIEKAASRGRLEELSGAALLSNASRNVHVHWDDVVEFALLKPDVMLGNQSSFHSSVACEALFYAVHILLSRSLSKRNSVSSDCVFILMLDSKYGGLVRLSGDLGNLEVDLSSPYQSMAEWIKYHANVSFSPVEQIWNTLGNVNWRDLGTLQIILATFHSMTQWLGPPRKSLASLAARHSLRLQKRRVECQLIEKDNASVLFQHEDNRSREIVDIDTHSSSMIKKGVSRLKLNEGEILEIEDQILQKARFKIQEHLSEGNNSSYTAVALNSPSDLCRLHVGAHSSRLEPSWEDMSLWYQVQRQTKVLNIIKEHGTNKFLPELIVSGRIMHPGQCRKQNPKGCCDHPWCGTPVLVTQPVGEALSSVVASSGPFTAEEAIRCCRDCLAALRNAKMANIQHGDICPENIIRVLDKGNMTKAAYSYSYSYVVVSWGRAVLEDKDSPTMNLQYSSAYALQNGKLCPSSDTESLVYIIYFICSGKMHEQESIESALRWRQEHWGKRLIQQKIGQVSTLLKAFADYIDSLCGTPYPVDYDNWLKRLSRAAESSGDRGQSGSEVLRIKNVAESSGNSISC